MSTFVCHECNQVVRNPWHQYREKLEMVRSDGKERPFSKTIRLLCKDCMEFIVEARRGGPDQQEALFS